MEESKTERGIEFSVGPQALKDYWDIYKNSLAEMNAGLIEVVRQDPYFGPVLSAMTPEIQERQQKESLARTERALNGDWSEYLTRLRLDGAAYAAMGIPFPSWYKITTAVQRDLMPRLVKAYCTEPERLSSALKASQEFIDGAMSIIAEQYLDAKQRQVEAQRELAETRARELDASEQALRKRTAALEAVIGAMTEGVMLLSPQGELLVVNEAARRIAHAEDARGNTGVELFKNDGVTPVPPEERPMAHALAGRTVRDVELILKDAINPDGLRVVADGRPVYADGSLLGGLVTFRDVTERHRLLELQRRGDELEKQNVLFQEASRLKSEFLASMSHELRTPLNAIIGFSELIHDGIAGEVSEQQTDFLDDILRSSRHLLQLINDVLDLAKVEAGRLDLHPEDFSLSALTREVVAVMRANSAKKGLVIDVESDPGVDRVRLDPGRMKQVLFNYLSNAVKFSPQNGRIAIGLRSESPNAVRVEVTDAGPGISEEDQSRMFREFEQVRGPGQAQEGTGLGLALTRRLVEAMGGSIGMRSELGRGSTFYAVVPTRMERGNAIPQNIVVQGPSQDAPRVLVVDDDQHDRTLLLRLLTDHGYAVETAATAAQAIVRSRAIRFDAITLDLILPDAPGLDVLRTIRTEERNRETPVIVVSVAAEERLVTGFSVAGVLMKPVTSEALGAALDHAGASPGETQPVLVVDDDQASLRLADATLLELGYRPVCHSDPVVALDWISKQRPASILLDLLMPKMDGFTFLDRLRSDPRTALIPVFVWTVKDLDAGERARLRNHARTEVLSGKRQGSSLLRELETFLPARSNARAGAVRG